jgi:MHS family shikimate/dehydroshikimate transporter-like MFS transporter
MITAERRRLRRVAAAAVSGQAIEYYDFLLYASAAALVFGPVFFPSSDPSASTALAFATFALGFVMRPVGAIVFGHLGDRIGRRRTLLATLLIMGVATTLIGALPTYEQAGVAAPICLVALRCLQGLSLGGEWGGAALLAVEHAPAGKRALWGSLPQMGSPSGQIASTLALLWASQLPDDDFQSWGWRIPFLLTAVFLVIGIRARLLVTESPEFEAITGNQRRTKMPVLAVLRSHPVAVLTGLLSATLTTAGFYLVNTFTISYVVGHLHQAREVGLYGQIVTGSVQFVLVPVFGAWALRRTPRRLAAVSAILAAGWAFPLYALMDTGVPAAVWVGQGVAMVFLTGVWAVLPELLAAQFPVEMRYTGISLCVQGASVLGGLAPNVATWLLDADDGRPWLVAAVLCGVGVVSALGSLLCTTSARRPIELHAEAPRIFPETRLAVEDTT